MEINIRGRGRQVMYVGKAAEYAVASQLLLRLMSVSWPAIDNGFDLVADNGCRIQVKSSHLDGANRGGERYYWFPLPKTRIAARKGAVTRIEIPSVTRCDIVVFWGVEENRFWIVPSHVVKDCQGLALGTPNVKRFVGDVSDMRDMISLGYTYSEVAKNHGVHKFTVFNLLKGDKNVFEESTTSVVKKCEGAWHHIIDFGQPEAIELQAPATAEINLMEE